MYPRKDDEIKLSRSDVSSLQTQGNHKREVSTRFFAMNIYLSDDDES